MNLPFKARFSWQTVFSMIILFIGIGILYISLVRASLEIMAQSNNENKLRVKPLVFTISNSDNLEVHEYKFPEVNTLPTKPWYKVKEIRDELWIYLSNDPISKAKMILLIADKKITESQMLYKQNHYSLALDTGDEAFNKLKYAYMAVSEADPKNTEARHIKNEIYKASFAYKEIINSINQDQKLDQNRFLKLINDIDNWNEEKRQENLGF